MTKTGRPPKPTSLKLLQGNPGKRPIDKSEPKPRPLAPKPPAWIPGEAKKIWKDLSKKLEPLSLFTEIDYLEMQSICIAAAQLKEAQLVLQDKGLVMEIERHDKDGNYLSSYFQQRPEVSIVHKSMQIINALSGKFGLSPADRVGLGVKPQEQKDAFESFLNRGKPKKNTGD